MEAMKLHGENTKTKPTREAWGWIVFQQYLSMFALQYEGFYLHCRKVGGGRRGIMIHDLMCDLKTVLWTDRNPDPVNLYGSGYETGLDLNLKMCTIYAIYAQSGQNRLWLHKYILYFFENPPWMENAVLRVFAFLRLVGERIWCHGDGWGVRGRRQFSLLIIAQPLWPFPPSLLPSPLSLSTLAICTVFTVTCPLYIVSFGSLILYWILQLMLSGTQCCGSGMFIPDPGSIFLSQIPSWQDPGSGSALKNLSIF